MMIGCRPLRGLFIVLQRSWGFAPLHPRLYAIAALRGLKTLHQLVQWILKSLNFWHRNPLHSATNFSALEVAYAHTYLIQAGRQPGVKFIDGLSTLCRR
jgi:hypothetical protein